MHAIVLWTSQEDGICRTDAYSLAQITRGAKSKTQTSTGHQKSKEGSVAHLCTLDEGVHLLLCKCFNQRLQLNVADAFTLCEMVTIAHNCVAVRLKDDIHGTLTDVEGR